MDDFVGFCKSSVLFLARNFFIFFYELLVKVFVVKSKGVTKINRSLKYNPTNKNNSKLKKTLLQLRNFLYESINTVQRDTLPSHRHISQIYCIPTHRFYVCAK